MFGLRTKRERPAAVEERAVRLVEDHPEADHAGPDFGNALTIRFHDTIVAVPRELSLAALSEATHPESQERSGRFRT